MQLSSVTCAAPRRKSNTLRRSRTSWTRCRRCSAGRARKSCAMRPPASVSRAISSPTSGSVTVSDSWRAIASSTSSRRNCRSSVARIWTLTASSSASGIGPLLRRSISATSSATRRSSPAFGHRHRVGRQHLLHQGILDLAAGLHPWPSPSGSARIRARSSSRALDAEGLAQFIVPSGRFLLLDLLDPDVELHGFSCQVGIPEIFRVGDVRRSGFRRRPGRRSAPGRTPAAGHPPRADLEVLAAGRSRTSRRRSGARSRRDQRSPSWASRSTSSHSVASTRLSTSRSTSASLTGRVRRVTASPSKSWAVTSGRTSTIAV